MESRRRYVLACDGDALPGEALAVRGGLALSVHTLGRLLHGLLKAQPQARHTTCMGRGASRFASMVLVLL